MIRRAEGSRDETDANFLARHLRSGGHSSWSICIGALPWVFVNYLLSIYGITYPEEISYGGMKFETLYAEVNVRCLIIPAFTVMLSAMIVQFVSCDKSRSDHASKGNADTLAWLSAISNQHSKGKINTKNQACNNTQKYPSKNTQATREKGTSQF